jgi:urease accessory protein
MLCKGMREQYDLVAITNDIYTKEADTIRMRTTAKDLKPFVMTNLKTQTGLAEVVAFIEQRGMLLTAAR